MSSRVIVRNVWKDNGISAPPFTTKITSAQPGLFKDIIRNSGTSRMLCVHSDEGARKRQDRSCKPQLTLDPIKRRASALEAVLQLYQALDRFVCHSLGGEKSRCSVHSFGIAQSSNLVYDISGCHSVPDFPQFSHRIKTGRHTSHS